MTVLFSALLCLIAQSGGSIPAIEAPYYFAVSVEDMDRSVAWYRDMLSLELLDDTSADDGRWRIVNLTREHLFVELIWDARDEEPGRVRGIVKVGFRVPDVRMVATRIEDLGQDPPRVLDFERHRVRLIQLRDPDGNIIQLTSSLDANE